MTSIRKYLYFKKTILYLQSEQHQKSTSTACQSMNLLLSANKRIEIALQKATILMFATIQQMCAQIGSTNMLCLTPTHQCHFLSTHVCNSVALMTQKRLDHSKLSLTINFNVVVRLLLPLMRNILLASTKIGKKKKMQFSYPNIKNFILF